MEEYENPLAAVIPQAPPPEDETELAINFLTACQIHATDKFDKPQFALYKNGVGFAPLGNIMAICSEAKNGKSWLMMQMAVAILKGDFCGLTSKLENPNVLYFDTEQDKYDTKMILNRVHYCCHWDFNKDYDQFRLYSMDVFDKMLPAKTMQENRLIAITKAIEYYKPKVVFIDGVRDLIHDFNDLGQSADLVQSLMTIARNNQCLICTVLHVNPNSDKMRGHLGTEMQNKTTDVLTVKKEDMGSVKHFHVKQVAARHMDIDEWTFWISDKGAYPIPELIQEAEVISTSIPEDKYPADKANAILSKYISQGDTFSFTTLREKIRTGESIGSTAAKEWINAGVRHGILQCTDGKYELSNIATLIGSSSNSMEDESADPF